MFFSQQKEMRSGWNQQPTTAPRRNPQPWAEFALPVKWEIFNIRGEKCFFRVFNWQLNCLFVWGFFSGVLLESISLVWSPGFVQHHWDLPPPHWHQEFPAPPHVWAPNVDKMQILEVLCTGSRVLTPLKADIKVSWSSALPGFHPGVCEESLTQPRTKCVGALWWGCHCPEIKPFSHWNLLTKTVFCIYLPHLISTPAWLPQSQIREKDTGRKKYDINLNFTFTVTIFSEQTSFFFHLKKPQNPQVNKQTKNSHLCGSENKWKLLMEIS